MSEQPSPAPVKQVLCFPCALRMSILFRFVAPSRPQSAELPQALTAWGGSTTVPLLDDEQHPRFTIVQETLVSAQRFLSGCRSASEAASVAAADREVRCESHLPPRSQNKEGKLFFYAKPNSGSTSEGMFAGEDAPRHYVEWLCVACQGLYQFMDYIHAPLIAASVRASPFYDSKCVSVNVNVNRCFTFTWLAAATRYYDRAGTFTARPDSAAVVPEELSNFKEFYMSDLRARVLMYLNISDDDVRSSNSSILLGKTTYEAAVTAEREKAAERMARTFSSESSLEPPVKRMKGDADASLRDAGFPSSPNFASQAFVYSANNEGVVCEIYCRHHPTEGLVTREVVPATYCSNRSEAGLTYGVLYDHVMPHLDAIGWGTLPPTVDSRGTLMEAATVSCSVEHANIYILGNYRKMMRNLSQSPWFSQGARIGSFSLQEVIANPILPFFFPHGVTPALQPPTGRVSAPGSCQRGGGGGAGLAPGCATSRQAVDPALVAYEQVFGYGRYKFHSAGREDVDVRMLGTGRPFVLELISPCRERFTEADLQQLAREICANEGGSVEVFGLRPTDAGITVRLARHSESKVKRYRCVIWSSRAIDNPESDPHFQAVNAAQDIVVEQRTPLRVLHRRSLHARPRTIHSMTLTPLNEHWFVLDVETQAGTYVKEFVHGDMGRTLPNLGSLLNSRTDILQLDVVGMAMQDLDAPITE